MSDYNRRRFIQTLSMSAAASLSGGFACSRRSANRPNIIIIFCDDLGYGDLSAFGHPTIHTPNLDRMAQDGQKWTHFYAGASVCTPSRAALLTGRLPIRSGMCSDESRVLFPDSLSGLPQSEVTIAEALKPAGYNTACVGKWHLGHLPPFLPTKHGFDTYFGIPYSNDMDLIAGKPYYETCINPESELFQVPLMRDEEVIEKVPDQTKLTRRYTEEAISFIKNNKKNPFFLYLAHSMPHVPLFRSKKFTDHSLRGRYGDVIEELDWSVGQILQTLKKERLAENTLVVFTSDNGPWLWFNQHGGSAGLLRNGKGTTFEGGMREPTIFWWPGGVDPGLVQDMGSTLDLLPTICALAGVKTPEDKILDGYDLSPVLFGNASSPRQTMYYYRGRQLYAVRHGRYKAHYITQDCYGGPHPQLHHDPPLLYDLGEDPGEKFNIAANHAKILDKIESIRKKHLQNLVPGEDQLTKRSFPR